MAARSSFLRSTGASRPFTIGVALVTGIVFGLFPALHTSNPDLVSTLKEASGRSGTGVRHKRVRSALVVAEMALALVLLVGAALLIRSFVGLRSVESGSTRATCSRSRRRWRARLFDDREGERIS